MNILIDYLPKTVEIDGQIYAINSNFRTSLLFTMLMEDSELTKEQVFYQALELYYPVIPANATKAINKILDFFTCGKNMNGGKVESNKPRRKVLDYEKDSSYIYSAFMSQYGIDLQDIDYMHWWKFKALLDNLNDDNKLCEIIKYRSTDVNKIKDKEQKAFYKKMQEIYKLDANNITEEDLQKLEDIKASILGI